MDLIRDVGGGSSTTNDSNNSRNTITLMQPNARHILLDAKECIDLGLACLTKIPEGNRDRIQEAETLKVVLNEMLDVSAGGNGAMS